MENGKAENGKISKHSIPNVILDDLCSRFIITSDEEDRTDLVRICFQVELAHWFYLDFFCTDENYKLQPCGIREFAAHIFQHVPFLQHHKDDLDTVLNQWREYKLFVPTFGAILLDTNLTHVLLVQSYWAKASWGFPKGKVSANEEPWNCAVREVREETGFDIGGLIDRNDYLEWTVHEQLVRLYVVGGVPRVTRFRPRSRNEIRACEWFALADLPATKKDATPKQRTGVSANAFFMVMPFVKRLLRWVADRQAAQLAAQQAAAAANAGRSARRSRHKSTGDSQGVAELPKSTPNAKRDKKNSKRQLFTPLRSESPASPAPVETESPEQSVASAWLNFKLDRQAILDSLV